MLLVSVLQGAARDVFLTALPHGGQRVARRNAWASMSADAALARTRRDVAQVLQRAAEPATDPVRRAR